MLAHYAWILVAFGVLLPHVLSAGTIRVPGDQPTVQAGMNAAADGDTVLVAPGTYAGAGNRDLSFGGKDLVVVSEGGAGLTIIDCQGTWGSPHRGFVVTGGIMAAIQGFTIINGYADGSGGGGISSVSSNLTLVDCVVRDCEAGTTPEGTPNSTRGGGLCCSGGTIEAAGCAFNFNECGDDETGFGSGAGVCCEETSGEFTECEFRGNTSHASGGGAAGGADLVFQSCVFRSNRAGDDANGWGGGFRGSSVFRDVVFDSNHSDRYGGGAYGDGTFEDVVFDGNYARVGGGGLGVYGATVTNALFTDNVAGEQGGAIRCSGGLFQDLVISGSQSVLGGAVLCYGGDPVFRHATLVGNQAEVAGSAVYCSHAAFSDVVIAFNIGPGEVQAVVDPGSLVFDCSDIYGNDGGDWTGSIASQYGVNGNISADPLFCDAQGGDFTIDAASPCAPTANTCRELIGALGIGCGMTSVEMQRSTWGGIKALYR